TRARARAASHTRTVELSTRAVDGFQRMQGLTAPLRRREDRRQVGEDVAVRLALDEAAGHRAATGFDLGLRPFEADAEARKLRADAAFRVLAVAGGALLRVDRLAVVEVAEHDLVAFRQSWAGQVDLRAAEARHPVDGRRRARERDPPLVGPARDPLHAAGRVPLRLHPRLPDLEHASARALDPRLVHLRLRRGEGPRRP